MIKIENVPDLVPAREDSNRLSGGRDDPPEMCGARDGPPIRFGTRGHPLARCGTRGDPPLIRNNRDGPFNFGLTINGLAGFLKPDGRGAGGWVAGGGRQDADYGLRVAGCGMRVEKSFKTASSGNADRLKESQRESGDLSACSRKFGTDSMITGINNKKDCARVADYSKGIHGGSQGFHRARSEKVQKTKRRMMNEEPGPENGDWKEEGRAIGSGHILSVIQLHIGACLPSKGKAMFLSND